MKSAAIHKCNLLVASRRYWNGQYPDNKKPPYKRIAVLHYGMRQVLLVAGAEFEPCGTLKTNHVPLPLVTHHRQSSKPQARPTHAPTPELIRSKFNNLLSNPDLWPKAPAPRSGSRDHRAVSLGLCAPLRHQCWTRLELGSRTVSQGSQSPTQGL